MAENESIVSDSIINEETDSTGRYFPPVITSLVTLSFWLMALYGYTAVELREGLLSNLPDSLWFLFNPALGNLMILIGGFFGLMIPIVWFTFFSGWQVAIRVIPLSIFILLVTLFFVIFRIEHLDGNLVPVFVYRNSLSPDRELEELSNQTIDLQDQTNLETSPADFAQFLGPSRNLVLDRVELEQNWSEHPPKELWRFPVGAGWSGFVAVDNHAVTMEQRDEYEYVTCYSVVPEDPSKIKPLWTYRHKARHETAMGYVGPRATPTIYKSKVYAQGATGNFVCLDAVTGKLLWQHDLMAMFGSTLETDEANVLWGRAGSPLIVSLAEQDLVVIPAGGPDKESAVSIVAFDASSGEEVWRAGNDQISYVSPSLMELHGEKFIISVNENTITAHVPDTGKVVWETEWPGNSSGDANCSQPHLIGENQILISKSYGRGAKVFDVLKNDAGEFSTELVWENARVLKTKFTNVAIKDGYAYGLSEGILECTSIDDSKRMWRERGFNHGQLMIVGNSLLVMSEEGELAIAPVSPEGFNETGRIKALESRVSFCWNNLCLYEDMLLLRNAEQAACFRVKLRGNSDQITKPAEDVESDTE